MDQLGRGEILLMVVAGYVAIMSLVRLMAKRRNHLVGQVQRQLDAEVERRKKAAKASKTQQQREAA